MTWHRHYGRYLLLRMYKGMGRVMVVNREGVWRVVMMRRQLRKFEGGYCRNCRRKNPRLAWIVKDWRGEDRSINVLAAALKPVCCQQCKYECKVTRVRGGDVD